ncbi:hypothetical protein GCM10009841_03450 [Microlunatus panaciterrae]
MKPRAVRRREQSAILIGGDQVEVADLIVAHNIVKISATCDIFPVARETPCEVDQVLTVASHLAHRMKPRATRHSVDTDEALLTFPQVRRSPLLKFDDDVRRPPRDRMAPREEYVGPLRSQWKLKLKDDLDTAEARVHQLACDHRDTPLPRSHF